jgi:tRNA G46 methylase TrmB
MVIPILKIKVRRQIRPLFVSDLEIKLDEDGYVLPASDIDDIFKR